MVEQKSFRLYKDLRDSLVDLTTEEKGQLFDAILNYVNEGVMPEDCDRIVRTTFRSIKNQLDDDAVKYQEKAERRARAGAKGAAMRWHPNNENDIAEYSNAMSENDNAIEEDSNAIKSIAKIADTDTDTDTDIDTDTPNGVDARVSKKLAEFIETREQLDGHPMLIARQQWIAQKVLSISDDPDEQIAALDAAIKNGWSNIYPPRGKPKKDIDVLRILEG